MKTRVLAGAVSLMVAAGVAGPAGASVIGWVGGHGREWGAATIDSAKFMSQYSGIFTVADDVKAFDGSGPGSVGAPKISAFHSAMDGAMLIGRDSGAMKDNELYFYTFDDSHHQLMAGYRDSTGVAHTARLPDMMTTQAGGGMKAVPGTFWFAHITRKGTVNEYIPMPPYTSMTPAFVGDVSFVLHIAQIKESTLALITSKEYRIDIDKMTFRATAPTPGAMGALGLAGLTACVRRVRPAARAS